MPLRAQLGTGVQNMREGKSSKSKASACQVLQTALADVLGEVEGKNDVEKLTTVLANHAPSCVGQILSVQGQLHGCEADGRHHLLLATDDEDLQQAATTLNLAHSSLRNQQVQLQHNFTTPCFAEWSDSTGVGCMQIPEGVDSVCAGSIDVQVYALKPQKQESGTQKVDRQWMWDVVWADSVTTAAMLL